MTRTFAKLNRDWSQALRSPAEQTDFQPNENNYRKRFFYQRHHAKSELLKWPWINSDRRTAGNIRQKLNGWSSYFNNCPFQGRCPGITRRAQVFSEGVMTPKAWFERHVKSHKEIVIIDKPRPFLAKNDNSQFRSIAKRARPEPCTKIRRPFWIQFKTKLCN